MCRHGGDRTVLRVLRVGGAVVAVEAVGAVGAAAALGADPADVVALRGTAHRSRFRQRSAG